MHHPTNVKIPFYQDGKAVGLKEGIEKGIIMIATQMLKANVDIETIHKYTNLSIHRLNELKKEIIKSKT